MVASCCICGIEKGSTRDDNLAFHRFPKDKNLRSEWWEVTGKKYASAHVCSKHFRPEDYKNYEDTNLMRRVLKSSAVPRKSDNLDTVEFVQNCFLFNSTDLSLPESKNESLESVEQINIGPENSNKIKSDDSNVLHVGLSTSPQIIVVIRDLDNDLTDVTLNNSRTINNMNVESTVEIIDRAESSDTIDETAVENNSEVINWSPIKTSKTDGVTSTIELVEIADTMKQKNVDAAMECLVDEDKNETVNNLTAEDDFTDESDDELFNILTYSDDKTLGPTRPTKRKSEKNEKERNKRKRLRQIKKQRYQSDTLGVTRKEDFTNESAWIRFQNFIDETRTKYKILVRENRRLKQKITFYQHLLRYINKKRKTSFDKVND